MKNLLVKFAKDITAAWGSALIGIIAAAALSLYGKVIFYVVQFCWNLI